MRLTVAVGIVLGLVVSGAEGVAGQKRGASVRAGVTIASSLTTSLPAAAAREITSVATSSLQDSVKAVRVPSITCGEVCRLKPSPADSRQVSLVSTGTVRILVPDVPTPVRVGIPPR